MLSYGEVDENPRDGRLAVFFLFFNLKMVKSRFNEFTAAPLLTSFRGTWPGTLLSTRQELRNHWAAARGWPVGVTCSVSSLVASHCHQLTSSRGDSRDAGPPTPTQPPPPSSIGLTRITEAA